MILNQTPRSIWSRSSRKHGATVQDNDSMRMMEISNLIEFLNYVSAFNRTFPERIKGSSAVEIDEFERLAGLAFPPHYRAFLKMMGASDGGLKLAFEGTTNVGELITYYREEVVTGNYSSSVHNPYWFWSNGNPRLRS